MRWKSVDSIQPFKNIQETKKEKKKPQAKPSGEHHHSDFSGHPIIILKKNPFNNTQRAINKVRISQGLLLKQKNSLIPSSTNIKPYVTRGKKKSPL